VMVAAVYDGDIHGKAGQAVGGVDAGKAATDDDDAGTVTEGALVLAGCGHFAQCVHTSLFT